jgi:tetratricopeptide (TPR) repeat protein
VAALAAEPESAEALEMLEGLQRAPGRERDLVATLRRRAELELDVRARKADAARGGGDRRVAPRRRRRGGDAREVAPRGDDADVDALDTLARLRGAQGRTRRWPTSSGGARGSPTTRPRRRAAPARSPSSTRAPSTTPTARCRRTASCSTSSPTTSRRARRSSALRARRRWRDLEDALRGRLDVAVSSEERSATRLRLARLAEERFQSNRDARGVPPRGARRDADARRGRARARAALHPGAALERPRRAARAPRRRLAAEGDARASSRPWSASASSTSASSRTPRARSSSTSACWSATPSHVGALAALARLAEADGQWERAVEMLDRALDKAPQGAASGATPPSTLAAILERLKDEAGGQAALRRALELRRDQRAARSSRSRRWRRSATTRAPSRR